VARTFADIQIFDSTDQCNTRHVNKCPARNNNSVKPSLADRPTDRWTP